MNFIGPYGCYEFLNFQRQSNTASLVTISNQVKRQHGRIPTKIQGSAHGRRQMVGGGEVQELSGALETQDGEGKKIRKREVYKHSLYT